MNHQEITKEALPQSIDENMKEALPFNKINYTAIVALELLGINAPSQEQIDILEMVLTFFKPNVMDNLPNSKNHDNFNLIAKQLFLDQFASIKH